MGSTEKASILLKVVGVASLVLCWPSYAQADAQVSVLTHHNDNNRSGANLGENILNTSSVNVNQFGRLFTIPVDGQIYAQPLYVPNVAIPNLGVRNVVYVATENDSLYAFDADRPGPPLWHKSLGNPANCLYGCASGNMYPLVGITATPVIDPVTATIYVINLHVVTTTTHIHYLHAIDIATGNEKFGGPVRIQGSVPGTGEGGTSIAYSELHERQRPALTLVNGTVVFGTGSFDDWSPFHGWLFAYNASSLQQVGIWNSTPNGDGGSMWQSGGGFVTDDSGNIYFMTANGYFDGSTNFGSSFVKISPSAGFRIIDYFTPSNVVTLNQGDIDLAASGPMRIPGTNYLIGGGKEGRLYLLDMTNMGRFSAGGDIVLQEFQATTPPPGDTGHIHCTPAYWSSPAGQLVYLWGENDHLKAYLFNNGLFQTTPVAQSAAASPTTGGPGMPGGFLSVSANGNTAGTGIVWASTPYSGDAEGQIQPGILRAFDASDVSKELWNSKQNAVRDDLGNFAKFVSPTVANGRVYMATFSNQLAVYGLLPAFSLSASPSSQTVTAGGATTFTISVNALNGFNGSVNLSVPPGTMATFNPASVTGSGTSILSLSTSSSTPAGNYSIVVTATSSSLSLTTSVTLAVNSFSLSASPSSQAVAPGSATSFVISIAALNGFNSVVNLSVPAGTSAAFSPVSVTGSGTSTLTVNAGVSTPPGNYPITVTAASGNLIRSTAVTLAVSSISVSVSLGYQTVVAGNVTSFTVGIGSGSGTSVALSVSGLPVGAAAGFNPAQVTGTGTSALNITTAGTTPPGTYPLTVIGTSGSLSTHAAFSLVVLSPASASFTPILVNSGGAAYTDSQGRLWSPDAGFSGGGTYATASPISGTADQTLYQDQRGGPMTYQFAVPNGSYRITLKFAELIQTTVGSRVFNVSLNGQTALQNFDVLAQTGGRFKAIDQQRPVTVTNGQIAIQFAAVVGNPMVSAIEIDLGFPPILVNSGGPAYADSLGRSWLADAGFSGGGVYTTTVSVSGTADPTLYQTQRGGTLTYQFNVPNGAYTVTLRFAELIQNAAGLRVFDVAINGQMALTNFDIFAQAGGNFKALDRQFPVTVAGSQITIQFTSVLGNPVLNALAIQ